MTDPLALLDTLETTVTDRSPAARLAFARLRQAIAAQRGRVTTLERERGGLVTLLRRSAALAEPRPTEVITAEMLDLLVAHCRAERGLVGLVPPTGPWRFVAARSMEGADLEGPDAQVSRSVVENALQSQDVVLSRDALSDTLAREASVQALRIRSVMCVPLTREGRVIGFVYLDHRGATDRFDAHTVETVRACAPLLSVALDRALRQPPAQAAPLPGVLTCSEPFAAQLRALARVAPFDVPVLLYGETGSGKGHIARQVHAGSPRAEGPFVHVNTAALPESLVESELFGVEAGAYTGARTSRPGRFEQAAGGTLFLDEIDSMPLAVQAKLLVALQERVVTRLGGTRTHPVDVRVLAAMGRTPEQALAERRLREDLYYRLGVVTVRVPALRERPEDLELMAAHALARARDRHGLPPLTLGPGVLDQLRRHSWPGNVRELENTLELAALLAEDGVVTQLPIGRLPAAPEPDPEGQQPWERRMVITRDEFQRVWTECDGDANAVAVRLGVAVRSVYRMRRRHERG